LRGAGAGDELGVGGHAFGDVEDGEAHLLERLGDAVLVEGIAATQLVVANTS
jgi:hypothetical protein